MYVYLEIDAFITKYLYLREIVLYIYFMWLDTKNIDVTHALFIGN